MAGAKSKIVTADESEIPDEPHIQGGPVGVQHIHARVEGRGVAPGAGPGTVDYGGGGGGKRGRRLGTHGGNGSWGGGGG